jgi:hypothetical protein
VGAVGGDGAFPASGIADDDTGVSGGVLGRSGQSTRTTQTRKTEGDMPKNMKVTELELEDRNWKAEVDLDTLMQASRIKADAKRYQAAIAAGKQRMNGLMKIVSDDDADED